MSRGRRNSPPACVKQYGFPLFCVSWVKLHDTSIFKEGEREEEDKQQKKTRRYLIFGGGGGEGRTGVRNGLGLAHHDFDTDILSESVHFYDTDDDAPYRMAIHPLDDSIICSFSNGCRRFELTSQDESEATKIGIKPSGKALDQLENAGQQQCLIFSTNGLLLAAGGEDGHLRVFEWPSLKIVLDQPDAHKSVKDMDFSLDGTFLASLGDSGPCRIWNLSTSAPAASLSVDEGERLGSCRFSRDGVSPLLFITVKQAEKGLIAYWDTDTWKKVGAQVIDKNPISAFSISSDGKFLATGTNEGDISIIKVGKMRPYQKVKEAHMLFVTSMEFSRDSRALVSASGDASLKVTKLEEQRHEAGILLFKIFVIFLAILLYYLVKNKAF